MNYKTILNARHAFSTLFLYLEYFRVNEQKKTNNFRFHLAHPEYTRKSMFNFEPNLIHFSYNKCLVRFISQLTLSHNYTHTQTLAQFGFGLLSLFFLNVKRVFDISK